MCVYNMLTFHLTRPGSLCTELNMGRERGAVTTWPCCRDRAVGRAAGGCSDAPVAV